MTKFRLAEYFSGPGGMGYGVGLSEVKIKKIFIQLNTPGLQIIIMPLLILMQKISKLKLYFVKK